MKGSNHEKSMGAVGLLALALAAVLITGVAAESVWAKTAEEINASVNACLDPFLQTGQGWQGDGRPRPRACW